MQNFPDLAQNLEIFMPKLRMLHLHLCFKVFSSWFWNFFLSKNVKNKVLTAQKNLLLECLRVISQECIYDVMNGWNYVWNFGSQGDKPRVYMRQFSVWPNQPYQGFDFPDFWFLTCIPKPVIYEAWELGLGPEGFVVICFKCLFVCML